MSSKKIILRVCGVTSLGISLLIANGHVWAGIGAVAAAHGASWKTGLALNALGVSDAALYGAACVAAGMTGGAAVAVGIGVGL